MNKIKLAGAATAGLLLFGMGTAAGASGGVKDDVPTPTPTVTETVKSAPVEKRIEVVTSPPECIEALDLSQQGFTYAAEAMGYLNDAVQAAGRLNVAGSSMVASYQRWSGPCGV
jgi:hypothetical protein